MNDLEKRISKEYKTKYAYFTGNATTALYLLFKSLNMQNKKILFPDITCMTPVNAAVYAGYEPVFCDVNRHDFTMNIQSLKDIIINENVGIVVPTHIYGHMCNMKEIYKVCKNNHVIVVEDCAQTVNISQYNDYAVTSFGHTKIFETQVGGGVLFYKEQQLKDKLNQYLNGLNNINDKSLSENYSREYYRIVKTLSGQKYYDEMRKLQYNSHDVFLGHFKENNELFEILDNKKNIIKDRNKRAELYLNNLDKDYFEIPNITIDEEYPLWRMTVLVKNIDRDRFVEEVRKNNIDISTWYPQLHKFYCKQDDDKFKNSLYISKNLINLWIVQQYSLEKIKNDIYIINKIAKNMSFR